MTRLERFIEALIITLILILAFAYPAMGQANRYSRDGLSFSYPAEWNLKDESDAQVQTVSLDRGKDEAKIIIVALRQQLTAAEAVQAQPAVTQAVADNLAQSMQQLGAQVERSTTTASIGGVQAQGVRLRATLHGEVGNADVYWLLQSNRLIHVLFIGSDAERTRAATAWNVVSTTLRVGMPPVAPPTQAAAPGDLNAYSYRQVTGNRIELYLDQWGRGYVHDLNHGAWVRVPDYSGRQAHHARLPQVTIQIHPSFCKTSDTMALMYAFGGLLVYDTGLYTAQNPNSAWVVNYEVSQRPQAFASISRSAVVNHIAQVNSSLALAAGTNWICVYDQTLHKWINYQAPIDDSTRELDRNLVLANNGAQVKVLNGPFCVYRLGTASWSCQGTGG